VVEDYAGRVLLPAPPHRVESEGEVLRIVTSSRPDTVLAWRGEQDGFEFVKCDVTRFERESSLLTTYWSEST